MTLEVNSAGWTRAAGVAAAGWQGGGEGHTHRTIVHCAAIRLCTAAVTWAPAGTSMTSQEAEGAQPALASTLNDSGCSTATGAMVAGEWLSTCHPTPAPTPHTPPGIPTPPPHLTPHLATHLTPHPHFSHPIGHPTRHLTSHITSAGADRPVNSILLLPVPDLVFNCIEGTIQST